MTPADVRDRVEAIRQAVGDDEVAHGMEDELHFDVLTAIAGGEIDADALAKEAIKTLDIDFARWCA